MALIICEDCGKEISDKSIQCIGCGNPIEKTKKLESEKDEDISYKSNNFKKFNFDEILKWLDDSDNQKIASHFAKEKQKGLLKSFILIITLLIVVTLLGLILDAGILLLIGTVSICIFGISSFFNIVINNNASEYIKKSILLYYEKYLPFIQQPSNESFTTLKYIKATSREAIIRQAFEMRADAIINVDSRTYTTSKIRSSFNGVGAQRSIDTKVTTHEDWSGTPIVFNNNHYHNEPFDIKEYLPDYSTFVSEESLLENELNENKETDKDRPLLKLLIVFVIFIGILMFVATTK